MKHFKKYILISLACAGIVTSTVLADGTDSQKTESNEIQPAVKQDNNDQNKQIVPVATEQNQIVKIEEQKQEPKIEPFKESAQQNLIEKLSFEELLKLSREKRIEYLTKLLDIINQNDDIFYSFPKSLEKDFSQKEQEALLKAFIFWLKDEWTKKETEKLTSERLDQLNNKMKDLIKLKEILKRDCYIPGIDDGDGNFSEGIKNAHNYNALKRLDYVYKPFFIKKLFPELESELKDIKLPEEKCQKVAANMVEQFKVLPKYKQLLILAAWLTNEWTPILS